MAATAGVPYWIDLRDYIYTETVSVILDYSPMIAMIGEALGGFAQSKYLMHCVGA